MIQLIAGLCLGIGIILLFAMTFLQNNDKSKRAKVAGILSLVSIYASPVVMLLA